jgi:hypothetical protein
MPTGFGGGGLSTVSTNSTLTGSGTSGSPLSVASWPLIYYSSGSNANNEALAGANTIDGSGFVLQYSLTFSHITVQIATADGVNNSDLGIYTKAGVRVANVGAQAMASTGVQTFTTVQGAQTIQPGLYAFAWASAGTTFSIKTGQGLPAAWFQSNNIGAATVGALPASISAIAIAPSAFSLYFALS